MFNFVVKYIGFLKHVPGMGLLFDNWLKIATLFTNPDLLDYLDEIEREVLTWEGVIKTLHKYGGVQFNYNNCEIGHIHSNGLLDIRFSLTLKRQLLREGRARDHHLFKNTGWISFYIKTELDKNYALQLLKRAYAFKQKKLFAPGGDHQTAAAAVVTVFA